ncbi:hypothetical protein ACHAXS_007457 [Conticribra weissflogii]
MMHSTHRFALAAAILSQTTPSASADLAAYQAVAIAGQDCEASAAEGTDTLQCTFAATAVPPEANTLSKITAGSCADPANASFTVSETSTSSGIVGVETPLLPMDVSDAEKNCATPIMKDGKPVCEVTKTACARADVVDIAQQVSVNAAMMDVEVTYYYATDGTFEVSVDTAAFDPESVSADATRTVGIQVWKGDCASATCEITAAGSDCYGSDPLEIGSSMVLCVIPEDQDVKVTGLQTVTVTPAPAGAEAMTVVAADGSTNFVTTVVLESGGRGATLSTLMIPLYYDEQLGEAGSVAVAGTALLEYISSTPTTAGPIRRQLEVSLDRVLQAVEERTPFVVSVPLGKKETPQVAQMEVLESAASGMAGVGLAGAAVAGAYYALF